MSRIAVKPELIRWARERAGLTESALVERFPKYMEWEIGRSHPTLRQLEGLAKKTMTPFGYFFLPEPNVGCHPAVFWLGAAAMVLIFSFFGFLDSRLPFCSPLAIQLSLRSRRRASGGKFPH